LDQYEKETTAFPDPMEACFCSNHTHGTAGMFVGISDCDSYMMQFNRKVNNRFEEYSKVIFHDPDNREDTTLLVKNQPLPANVTIGTFKDVLWVWGNKVYLF